VLARMPALREGPLSFPSLPILVNGHPV
jgi:hypothetical protein